MALSYQRQQELLKGQSSVGRKVYDCIPIGEAWPPNQIGQEARRKNYSIQINVINGILDDLVENGLVREVRTNYFMRAEVKAPPTIIKETVMAVEDKKEKDVFSQLIEIAGNLRHEATQLNTRADAIETIALSMTSMTEVDQKELTELRQWKASLKQLIGG